VQIEDFVGRHLFHLGLCGVYLLVILVIEKPQMALKRRSTV
jgi:hypothetical protein